MAKLISQSCSELLPALCLSRGYAAIWRWPEHSWMSDRPQKQATAKVAQATFSINTCLNCWSMCTTIIWWWKVCLAIVCMEVGFSQIRSHILILLIYIILCSKCVNGQVTLLTPSWWTLTWYHQWYKMTVLITSLYIHTYIHITLICMLIFLYM